MFLFGLLVGCACGIILTGVAVGFISTRNDDDGW